MTNACKNFLVTHLSYNGCVLAHSSDVDFKGRTWRVFLNRNFSMWRTEYDVVKLLDAEGKTIDLFSY